MIKKIYVWLHKKTSKVEERGEPSAGVWHNRVRQEVIDLCQKSKGRLLEVGCGEGLFLANLALDNSQLDVFGVDNHMSDLLRTKRRGEKKESGNIRLVHGDAMNLPFGDGSFDRIVCVNTFFNMESIDAVRHALEQMARVCKKKGRITFDFRNSANPFVRLKYKLAPCYDPTIREQGLPLNTYSIKHIREILDGLNLKIVSKTCVGFPVKALAPIIIMEAEKC